MADAKRAADSVAPVPADVDSALDPAKSVKPAASTVKGVAMKAVEPKAGAAVAVKPTAASAVRAPRVFKAAPRAATMAKAVVPNSAPKPVPQMKDIPMITETQTRPFEAIAPTMEKATADMTAKVKDMMEKNMKSMTEMTEFAKGNVEAMVESAKAAAAGAETLTTHFVETSKKSMEEAQAAFKTMTSAKTPNELMAAQNEFAKAQFDKAVANMSHFSETWMKLAGDVVQPISSRMAVAAETVKKSIAA
jgi:phasin family protein